jgi:hypothetical protein
MERTHEFPRSLPFDEVHGLEAALAKWISVLASPPLLGLAGLLLVGMTLDRVDVRLFGAAAAPAILLTPLVIWARMHRQRHDLAQTLGGAALGAGSMAAAFSFVASYCPGANLLCG